MAPDTTGNPRIPRAPSWWVTRPRRPRRSGYQCWKKSKVAWMHTFPWCFLSNWVILAQRSTIWKKNSIALQKKITTGCVTFSYLRRNLRIQWLTSLTRSRALKRESKFEYWITFSKQLSLDFQNLNAVHASPKKYITECATMSVTPAVLEYKRRSKK